MADHKHLQQRLIDHGRYIEDVREAWDALVRDLMDKYPQDADKLARGEFKCPHFSRVHQAISRNP